jgi:hypothetical protein
MARRDGALTKSDENKLACIHEHALKIAAAAMSRIMLGSDHDQHPNSWWRNHDKKIEEQTDMLKSMVSNFLE